MTRRMILTAMSAALLAPVAIAQQTTTTQTAPATETAPRGPVNDNLFAAAAAVGGIGEVTLSELGLQRATDPELKKFSQRAIDDHTQANKMLQALAAKHNLRLPTAADPRAQFCVQSLAGLSGAEFDRCYAKAQLIVHMDAVATFEAEAQRGQNPELKAFATKMLPTIKEHLKMIKPIAMEAMKAEQEKPGDDDAAHEPRER